MGVRAYTTDMPTLSPAAPLSGATPVSIDACALMMQGDLLVQMVRNFPVPCQVRVVLSPTRDATARRLQSRLQAMGCTVTKRRLSTYAR